MEVHGHTDNQGDPDYNQDLSERRASSVQAFFETTDDLDHIVFSTYGHGESQPIVSNDTAENQGKNRRVEVIIEPR